MNRFLLLLLMGFTANMQAQQSPILEQYIQSGMSANLALQQKELDIRKSIEAVRQSRSLFFPSLNFEANYTVAAGGRSIQFPIGDLLNPVYSTLNQLTQSNNFPALENQKIQFLPNNFQETKLSFAYPVYNSDLRYNRQIKELLLLSQEAQKAAYQQELRYNISLAYLQFIQANEAEKIWINARNTQLELRKLNESLVRNNVATRDIIADVDYEISKTDQEIYDLNSRQNTARAYFNFLINRDLQAPIDIDSVWIKQMPPQYELEQAVANALQNRKEFEVLRTGQSISNTVVDMNTAHKKLPELYVGGELGFQGFGYHYANDQAYALARVGMRYNLYDAGLQKSKIQEARIESDKLNLQTAEVQQQIRLQVTDRFNQLKSAQNAVLSAQKGLNAAEESFRILNNKYKAGQALHLEWSNAHNRLVIARLQTVLARLEVLKAHEAFLQSTNTI